MPGKEARERVDRLLVERGLAENRSKAQALILAGKVRSGEQPIDKPGHTIARTAPLEVAPGRRWVGRGAEKLGPVLKQFQLDPAGIRALDIGASTGGFTQLLLAGGALEVVALDVGRNQLDWKLRSDPRVHVREGVNARYLKREDLPFLPDWIVADVSFISLERVLPACVECLRTGGSIVALVKPQFEVGREHVGRGGIVKDRALHRAVLQRVSRFAERLGLTVLGVLPAALAGADGNQEYFLHLSRTAPVAELEPWQSWIDVALQTPGETT